MKFINLHQHTTHSLLDGCADIEALVTRAKLLNMSSLAITDHGTLSGALEFYLECKKQGVNPIVGVEMYLDDSPDRKGEYRHIVLLTKNLVGYRNLLKIVSEAHTNGFYYRPRTTSEIVFKYGEGLIVSTACMGGLLGKIYGREDEVKKELRRWKGRFGDDFYIEIQLNEITIQASMNRWLLQHAKRAGIKPVLTLDSHYVNSNDVYIQDFILAVRDRLTIDQINKVKYSARSLSLMGAQDIWSLSKDWKTALDRSTFKEVVNTSVEIAEKCDLKIPTGKFLIPDMGLEPFEFDSEVIGKAEHLGLMKKEEYRKRIKRELKVISKLHFHDYFLIVEDLVNWCRKKGIFVGPARGSVAGSLVSYALGITKVDPIEHGLIFERFLNESRVDMPDIDLDFDANKRDHVFDYIRERYGKDKVARVITFGTFGSVGAIRDIGRVFKLPSRPINELADEIYKSGGIDDAYKGLSGRLKDFWKEHSQLIKLAKRISGLIRNVGVHPCGTIVAPKAVYKYCPLQRVKGEVVSAYSEGIRGRELSEIGLVKLDILGLNTCSIISDTIDLIKESSGEDIGQKIWDIKLTDKKLLKEARLGHTMGMFQFETEAGISLLKRVAPINFDEIAALNAINRPGPLGSGAVQRFIAREGMGIDNELIEEILGETRGVLVYQEQVMQILHRVAGYSLVEADNIRKLAAKKLFKESQVKDLAKEFVRRCGKNIGKDDARELWKIIKEFTKYSFNKSHAISYAFLFFQTMFLKNYYPGHFFASLLSNTATGVKKDKKRGSELNKIYSYINEARRFDLKILPPDINKSGIGFTMENKGRSIRFGLSKIKGIKDSSAEEIISKRPFTSFPDFLERISGKIHKGKIVSLIEAGSFDSLGERLSIKRQYNSLRKDQVFNLEQSFVKDAVDAFGFILSHPFFESKVRDYLQKRYCITSLQLKDFNRWERTGIAGVIVDIDTPMSGKSTKVIKVQDHRGNISIFIDNEADKRAGDILKPFNIIFVSGRNMGSNRILCQGSKDSIVDITSKINGLVENEQCRTRKSLA